MVQISFAYALGTTVYFWKDGKGYEGQIIRRGYGESLHFQVEQDPRSEANSHGAIIYNVSNQEIGTLSFYQYQFGDVIFTDVGELAKKYLLIR